MTRCAGCSKPLEPAVTEEILRSGGDLYHLACVPGALLATAAEEYQAILRKGVRYFVDKYGDPAVEHDDLGDRFLRLGRAVEAERRRRPADPDPVRSG
ncbi:MAG: hypothetical protein ACRECT_07570 [Thermoplasmata archaeon]